MQYHSSLALVIASATTGRIQLPTPKKIIAVLVIVFEP